MAIDRKKIIDSLSKLEVVGNKNGIIEAFGVFINQLPAKIWTDFSERLTNKANSEIIEATEYLFVNAAHECGYHTGYGIITSEEWKAVVKPMIEKEPEDILHGAFAVLAAMGWADTEICELIPGEKMVVKAYNYYEADVVKSGRSSKKSAYMLRGISASFMDLAYGGKYDPSGKSSLYSFQCEQVKGIECGDSYGEFIVTKA